MSPALKLQIETAALAFIGSFLTAVGSSLSTTSFSSLSANALGALIIAAVTAAAHATYIKLFSSSIGAQMKAGAIK